MVGTAEYQVGFASSSWRRRSFSALKPGVQKIGRRRQRRQHGGDQAVNVEQRHDVQRTGRLASAPATFAMLLAEAARLRWRQRHDLGTRGRARRVQHQGDLAIGRRAGVRGVGRPQRVYVETENAGRTVGRRDQLDDRHADLLGHARTGLSMPFCTITALVCWSSR